MIIENKSNLQWKNYNAGYGHYVDIEPNSIFEVSDKVGKNLLRLLGADNWLVKLEKMPEDKSKKVIKKEKVEKVDEKEKKEYEKRIEKEKKNKKK